MLEFCHITLYEKYRGFKYRQTRQIFQALTSQGCWYVLKRPKYLKKFIQVSNQYSREYSWFLLLSRVYGDKCTPHRKNVHAVKFFIRKNKLIFLLVAFLCLGISQDYRVVSQWGGTTYQPPRKQRLCTAEPALPKRPPLSRGHISLSGPDKNGPPVWGPERQLPMTVSSQTQNLLITTFDAGTTSPGNLFADCW